MVSFLTILFFAVQRKMGINQPWWPEEEYQSSAVQLQICGELNDFLHKDISYSFCPLSFWLISYTIGAFHIVVLVLLPSQCPPAFLKWEQVLRWPHCPQTAKGSYTAGSGVQGFCKTLHSFDLSPMSCHGNWLKVSNSLYEFDTVKRHFLLSHGRTVQAQCLVWEVVWSGLADCKPRLSENMQNVGAS